MLGRMAGPMSTVSCLEMALGALGKTPQLEKNHVVPTAWQDEALARDGARVATQEESGVLGFPSRRGLTPRGSLKCNPEIPAFPGEE